MKANILNKKNTKKSKHGKKNWRKNIDVSDLEKKNIQKESEKLIEKNLELMKDEDLFQIDLQPTSKIKNDFLKKKTNRNNKTQSISINEERKIKRLASNTQKNNGNSEEEVYDLWANSQKSENKISNKLEYHTMIKYPKLPIPHPGQSYNPSQQDIKLLLNKIVELKPEKSTFEMPKLKKEPVISTRKNLPEEEDEKIDDFKVSNNPPVYDTQRKTKSEKKKSIRKKLNLVKQREFKIKKENRIKLANQISLKRIEKERKKMLEIENIKNKEEHKKTKEKERMLKHGFVEE
jgi:nucleolar protein 53